VNVALEPKLHGTNERHEMTQALSRLTGRWHNQHGSELDLTVAEDGRVTGHFRSGTGLAKDEPCDVVGFASDGLVAFTANFGRHDSLTSWTGHWVMERGTPTIQASWNMCVGSPKPSDPDVHWKGVWTGADVFEPGPAVETPLGVIAQPSHPVSEGGARRAPSGRRTDNTGE
jgi:hypothetical protein